MHLIRNYRRRRSLLRFVDAIDTVAQRMSAFRERRLPRIGKSDSRCISAHNAGHEGFSQSTSGASAIEFAIVAPVFLALVLGIIGYGLYLGTLHSLAQITADAARASVAGLTDAERSSIAAQHVQSNAPRYPLIDPHKITITSGVLSEDPDQFSVVVSYDASQLPIWHFDKFVPLPPKILRRTATIQRGGY